MSAFCVYGMSFTLALKRAEKKVSSVGLSMEDWRKQVHDAAEQILLSAKPTQVSPTFDAPQFAQDWIEVAERTSRVHAPRVMVRAPKVDKHGNVVKDKRTGLPALGWKPYTKTNGGRDAR
ncbi:hypothetical protein NDR89_20105 [Cupriavidus gilardii]|uniref:Uncharacterized protein n=1 Tax=Cupriavidus gilardii TaxID=82541 RepID=A0ABY4VRN5_9BURK|nr:hypothetical protein [Cupriavidus gilardii]USE78942.1 hypothetical protein NDR89_20105 [Cupriavidus gilardii]